MSCGTRAYQKIEILDLNYEDVLVRMTDDEYYEYLISQLSKADIYSALQKYSLINNTKVKEMIMMAIIQTKEEDIEKLKEKCKDKENFFENW